MLLAHKRYTLIIFQQFSCLSFTTAILSNTTADKMYCIDEEQVTEERNKQKVKVVKGQHF